MSYDTCSQCTRFNVQLVQSIHLLSLNPFLPQVSKRIYSTLHNSSPTTIATYLLCLYAHYGPEDVLVRSVRHPICDVGVCREIRRLWDMRRGVGDEDEDISMRRKQGNNLRRSEVDDFRGESSSGRHSRLEIDMTGGFLRNDSEVGVEEERQSLVMGGNPPKDFSVEEDVKTQDRIKIGPLSCVELPRRLFRPPLLLPTPSSKPARASQTTVSSSNQRTQDPLSVNETFSPTPTLHPLLIYLFSTYSPSSNSHKGYPLCRAILARDVMLIQFLLHHGADPSVKGWMALELAIHMKDLELVRMLVDRNWVERQTSSGVSYLSKRATISKDGVVKGSEPMRAMEIPGNDGREGRGSTAGGGESVQGREEEVNGRCKKRRRISITIDPKFVDLAMKKGAHDVVEYFVKEKGIMPSLGTIMSMNPDRSGKESSSRKSNTIGNQKSRSIKGKRRLR
ncbi:hypothetical protein M231_06937 [Tremella mesenterica]|uniref:Uncharacterized protein n=1 Tax=Tremella mesenterica TaxID=5217 RepID=A0A4Q1BAI3_TREME|nr:hypothetical protein M231_06937 [Tremella mesenterica]